MAKGDTEYFEVREIGEQVGKMQRIKLLTDSGEDWWSVPASLMKVSDDGSVAQIESWWVKSNIWEAEEDE